MESAEIMKKCQRGFGNYKGALDDANNLLAECYAHIGKLDAQLNEVLFYMNTQSREYLFNKWPNEK
jgi:hypothetical protein